MRSSTSSSESLRNSGRREDPPLRAIPAGPWRSIAALTLAVFVAALAGWEGYWRSAWFVPSYRNSDGLWTLTHDRIDREGPGGTVIVGSSRVLFDLNLEAWREETGTLPIQLALEGTGARPFLAHIAQDTEFSGLLVVGVTPPLFFPSEPGLRTAILDYLRKESPAQRVSQLLSMTFLEPYLAFYDPDTAWFTVLERQKFWPEREGKSPSFPKVRKLSLTRRTRQNDMWNRVELDPEYRKMAQDTWLAFLHAPRPPLPPPEELKKQFEALLEAVATDVRRIRERGGEVVFVRAPSSGPFLEAEKQGFPRERTWDPLLRAADAAGVHYEDHADLQEVELPEWSHIRAQDTERFTRALIGHLRKTLAQRGTPREELSP